MAVATANPTLEGKRLVTAMKWLVSATAKPNEYKPKFEQPAYLPEHEITIATNGHRLHLMEGRHAQEVEGYPDAIDVLERLEQFPHYVDVGLMVTGATIEAIRSYLKWFVKGYDAIGGMMGGYKPVNLILAGNALRIEAAAAEGKADVTFPVLGQQNVPPAEIPVQARYLHDALMAYESGRGINILRMRIPKAGIEWSELGKAAAIIEYPALKAKAYILPVKVR